MFDESKRLEQRLIAEALRHVVAWHHKENDTLSQAISHLPERPTPADVAACIRLLRVALREPSPFLHDCALAVFVGAPLFGALQAAVARLPAPASTLDLFGDLRAEANGVLRSSQKGLRPILDFFRGKWSAFMGERVGTVLFHRYCPFDPKVFARNSSGQFMEEQFHDRHGKCLAIDWTVGPTPTVEDHLAPETTAAIEALENRTSSCFPHTMWVYVNIQSLQGASERRRSTALFEASKRHPHAFRVASISVDAPFYLGKVPHLKTLDDHKKNLLQELHKGFHPTLQSWYAFSLLEGEHQLWWHIVEEVVEKAAALAETADDTITSFHELMVLGLVRAWQGFCCRQRDGWVMSTVACKECIDRGGSINAAFVWALSKKEEPERAKEVMAVLWGRPLLARNRLIVSLRTEGFEALVRAFPPEWVERFLDDVWQKACQGLWRRT